MSENVKVKAKFKGTTRRFEIACNSTWQQLLLQLRQLFDARDEFIVKYCDDEKELVSLSSQEELNEAIRVCKKTSRLLYLHLEDPFSQQTSDQTLLKLEQKQDLKKNKSSTCYSDVASAMADQLSALNSHLEKSSTLQPSKKQKAGQQNKANNQQAKKNRGHSHYSDLASTMAPELSALNEKMSKPAQKEKQTARAAVDENQQQQQNKENKKSSCYSDLAATMAPELSAVNEKMSKPAQKEKQTAREAVDENQQQQQNKENKKSSYYSDLADTMAAEFSAMNAKLESEKGKEMPKTTDESHDPIGKAAEPQLVEPLSTCFINLEEIMMQSNNYEQHEPQRPDMGASRGWYDLFGEEQASVSVKKSKTSKKKKKKQNDYSELGEIMSSELSNLCVKEPVETANSTNVQAPPTTTLDCKRQLDGQCQDNPKRSKKTKKLNCYAQLAEDASTMFADVNKKLEEQQRELESRDIPIAPIECEAPLLNSSPESTSSEPFVFVSNNGEPLSIEAESIEFVNSGSFDNSNCVITGCDGATVSDEEQGEEDDRVSNSTTFDNENSVPQSSERSHEDMKEMVKEILKESMPSIIHETVQRLQTPNGKLPATPCNTPQEDITPPGIVTHNGITCDHCGKEIQGIRYKCGNCKDFDLCEPCEELPAVHNIEHVFVKLRYPAPGIGRKHGEMVAIFKKSVYKKNCDKRQKEKEQRRAVKEAERERKRVMKLHKHALKTKEKERKKEEKATSQLKEIQGIGKSDPSQVVDQLGVEFVCHGNHTPGCAVLPGQKFLKSWIIINTGTMPWNKSFKLECIEGSILGTSEPVPSIEPGTQDEVSAQCIAPEVPGTYSSKWQMSYGNKTFGPYLKCEICVPEEDKPIKCYEYRSSLLDAVFAEAFGEPKKLVDEPVQQTTVVDDDSSSEYLSSEETPESSGLNSNPEPKEESSLVSNGSHVDLEWDADGDDIGRLCYGDAEYEDDSDSSEGESTIPIPSCFDPDAPLTAKPYHVRADFKNYKRRSYSSLYLNSFESVDPAFKLTSDSGPSSLPNMRSLNNDEKELSDDDTNSTTDKTDSTPIQREVTKESEEDMASPSGCVSPRASTPEAPISKQPSVSRQDSIPLVVQPTTVTEPRRSRSDECEVKDQNNLVSEVLSSAIDVVTTAGRAALATVDNFINGTPDATAVYKPEDNCEVTVNRRGPGSEYDSPAPPHVRWPVNRQPNTTMDRLIEMGFGDRRLNERLLRKHNDDISATIEELLGHTDNDWSGQRH